MAAIQAVLADPNISTAFRAALGWQYENPRTDDRDDKAAQFAECDHGEPDDDEEDEDDDAA